MQFDLSLRDDKVEKAIIADPDTMELLDSIEEIAAKARRWDALEARIGAFYYDENGDEWPDEKFDLCDIGEAAATAFGFL